MAQKQYLADTRPTSALGGLTALLFAAPVAVAAALIVWSESKSHTVAAEALAAVPGVRCNIDADAGNGSSAASLAYFDVSWLPGFTDFVAVAGDNVGGRLWNPVSNSWLTSEQLELLSLAYKVGFEDGGDAHAKLLQAVLMQETIAGQLGRLGHLSAPLGKRSYGVMQVKVAAARDVLSLKPKFGDFKSDDELAARLIADDEFNLRIASAYLKYLRKSTESDHEALVAYNLGPNAAKRVPDPAQYRYVLSIESYLSKVVAPFNGKFANDVSRTASM